MIKLQCPHCGKRITVREESAGKKGKCPRCGKVLRIPSVAKMVEPDPQVESESDFLRSIDEPEGQIAPVAPAHSLGIASLVIGILAFFVFWIPYIGAFFAGIGFVLGVTGLLAAIVRKGSGVGYPVAGTAVCGGPRNQDHFS